MTLRTKLCHVFFPRLALKEAKVLLSQFFALHDLDSWLSLLSCLNVASGLERAGNVGRVDVRESDIAISKEQAQLLSLYHPMVCEGRVANSSTGDELSIRSGPFTNPLQRMDMHSLKACDIVDRFAMANQEHAMPRVISDCHQIRCRLPEL